MMKFLVALVAIGCVLAVGPDDKVKEFKKRGLDFQGSSGSFKIRTIEDKNQFIQVKQSKVYECDTTGKKVGKFELQTNGGDWTEPATDAATGVTSATYTKSDAKKGSFSMKTYFTEATKDITDTVTGQVVTVPANKLKFSLSLSALVDTEFEARGTNFVCYQIEIRSKGADGSKLTDKTIDKKNKGFVANGGEIDVVTDCKVDGAATADCVVVTQDDDKTKTFLNFRFTPKTFNSLAYDPEVSVDDPSSAAARSVVGALAVSALGLLLM